MGKTEELSATDKLLQVIKGKEGESVKIPPALPPQPQNKSQTSFKIPKLNVSKEKKSINVGIDIGETQLRLVKARKSDRRWQILDAAVFSYPNGIIKDSVSYNEFIGAKIKAFCNVQECDLWALISSANVEIRHLRVPKLAKKEISNAVYWSFKKEFPYSEAEFDMDYEIREEIIGGGSAKLSVMAYISPKSEIAALKSIFSGLGLSLAGITIQTFAVQNIFRSGGAISGDSVACLYIGNDSSQIDMYSRGNLTMTREIKAGRGSMAEALCDGLKAIPRDCSYEDAVKIINGLSPDAPNDLLESSVGDLNGEQIFGLITPALDRVVRQVERTFDYYRDHFGQPPVQSILISGVMNASERVATYFSNQLGHETRLFDPTVKGLLGSADCLSRLTLSEKMAFIPSLGAACSDEQITPNLLYGYKYKEEEVSQKKINRTVIAGFMVLVFVFLAYFISQNFVYSQKKNELKALESKLASFSPVLDKTTLMTMAGEIQKTRTISQSLAERYQSVAILSELSSITPREIKLVRFEFGPAGQDGKKSEIIVEGIIQGDPSNTESLLTGYTFKLDSSPLFESITIQKSSSVPFIGREALQFVVNAKIS